MTTSRPGRIGAILALLAALAAVPAFQACRTPGEAESGSAAKEPAARDQLAPNPSFTEIENGRPAGWRTRLGGGDARFETAALGREDSSSVLISSAEGADAAWLSTVPIKPYAKYRLAGWVKTESLAPLREQGGALIAVNREPWRTPAISGTQDWTRVETDFDSGPNDVIELACLFGGRGRASGKAWFDDVTLSLLSATDLRAPRVVIDPARTLAPMSEMIYGQFIEHLGRCIYQGIWAEMLEDRKFFDPVGEGESPWTVVGEGVRVTMDKTRPLAGAHVPRIALPGGRPGGLSQGNLAVVAGKAYAGRVVLSGDQAAAPVKVSLVWGEGAADRQTVEIGALTTAYVTHPLEFTAGAASESARLEIVSEGGGRFRLGTVSLMPADNVEGFRPEVLARLRELRSPIYRWPGGNFVSGYDWKDGIGDRDRRPPRKNPAWQGIEHNDVGIHEYMDLMRLLETEGYIAVNSGLGGVEQAAEQVEYLNGPAASPMGQLRAANGRAEPWGVEYWSIGNEMYGNWQLGHMPLEDYVRKHNDFAAAMRAKDPSIKLIAVGAVGRWSESMLAQCADNMDSISEHFYVQEKVSLPGHVDQVPAQIRRIAEAHREYRKTIPALQGKDIRIALDEWNYWYGPHLYGELGTRYFLKDALGIAAGFNEYARQSDMYVMANYAQTVNVIGAIKTTKTAAELDATGIVLRLYRHKFGTVPVAVTGDARPLDVMATVREGDGVLTLSIVNPTAQERTLRLDPGKTKLPKQARLYLVSGDDPLLYNEPGKPRAVDVVERADAPFGKKIAVPPISISIYEIPLGL